MQTDKQNFTMNNSTKFIIETSLPLIGLRDDDSKVV
jgi:hypothetical protein